MCILYVLTRFSGRLFLGSFVFPSSSLAAFHVSEIEDANGRNDAEIEKGSIFSILGWVVG